ncbi:16S rRNA (cytidine(1402)-2'-O)-methyltransferase [Hydrogenophaga sp. 5NK40-0174]|uniref:16S rRNA (cytidine(1402)-2'-O)-methyltransferase n=1 Tax=Hydrogenophaga sp. 5NK40-0174 TaxID=3127649 RepID=UPI00333F1107
MVATPIGNLADISLRAVHVLHLVDVVACEDTRHTGALLQSLGLHKPLLALHEHNELEASASVVARLQAGERVAYVSDAGTPGVSDPGARLVETAQAAGLRCIPVPGASAVTALLSVSGLVSSDPRQPAGRFVFMGFLPAKGAERKREIQALAAEPRTIVLLEAPHRMAALTKELAESLGERVITVGRELTKQFEEIEPIQAANLPQWLTANAQRSRGEYALVIHPAEGSADEDDQEATVSASAGRTLSLLLEQLPLKSAVKLCAEITGESKNALYDAALALKAQD